MATIGFAPTSWAWSLVSPPSGEVRERLGVSTRQSILVAVPVLVGPPGCIPAGALTSAYGLTLPVVPALPIAPVLLLIRAVGP
ncbi:hypothetical protein [Streptomyces sp. SM10]|uniref:hypothetical protein n=1 Tax=Streptomyces sp. SM10 TaxID=565556 RepID=UPI000CDB6B15